MVKLNTNVGNSYDLLKFIMALLIVAIHTNAFYGPWFCTWVQPVVYIAVPVFFVLSSMFFFIKVRKKISQRFSILKQYIKRICTLYCFWFIMNIPFIQNDHHYFIDAVGGDFVRLILDILLRYTFSGSWFFSSLALAVVIYTVFLKFKYVLNCILTCSVILLLYISWHDILPPDYVVFYGWLQTVLREELSLTICSSLGWVGIGVWFSSDNMQKIIIKARNIKAVLWLLLSLFTTILYVFNCSFGLKWLNIILIIVLTCLYVITAGSMKIKQNMTLYKLRKMSVLFFMLHFIIIFTSSFIIKRITQLEYVSLADYVGFISGYLIVLSICYISSSIILKLSGYKRTRWLSLSY